MSSREKLDSSVGLSSGGLSSGGLSSGGLSSGGRFEPRSLEWQDNGELAATEMFELLKRLRAVESGEHVNELWRLSQKA